MESTQSKWSEDTLEELPARVLKFLSGLGKFPAIRALVVPRGYDDAEHALGWRLLHDASGYAPAAPAPAVDPVVAAAYAALDAYDNENFPIFQGALRRLHPAQEKVVFAGLSAQQGAASVQAVATFLDRVEGLAASKEKADQDALATLEKRGLGPDKRRELAALVETARGLGASPASPATPAAQAGDAVGDQVARLERLKAWYDDWAGCARKVVRRRDQLMALGLAHARRPGAQQPEPPEPPQ